MQSPDVRSRSYLLLHDRLFTTRYDEKTRKGEGKKNKMPRKKFSHSKFLKQKLRQKMVKISSGSEEVGQLSREFLDQSNRAIFYASWLRFLSREFAQDGKNL